MAFLTDIQKVNIALTATSIVIVDCIVLFFLLIISVVKTFWLNMIIETVIANQI